MEALHVINQLGTSIVGCEVAVQRDDADHLQMRVNTMTNLEDHIRLVAGRMYSPTPDEEEIVEAIVSESALIETALLLDDVITMPRLITKDGTPLRVRVVGVFTNSQSEDLFWVSAPPRLFPELLYRWGSVPLPLPL